MREHDVIERLRATFPDWGIGDDTAVLGPPDGDLLLASDAVVEGVHFRLAYSTPGQAVQKAITSNVSDIYAMGGEPHAILATAGLPKGCGEAEIHDIIEGAAAACTAYGVKLVGGDTVSSPGGYFVDVAIAGSVARGRAVKRSGAGPGDAVVLFGGCGGAAAGRLILESLFWDHRRGGDEDDEKMVAALVPDDEGLRVGMKEVVTKLTLSMNRTDIEALCADRKLDRAVAPVLALVKRHLVPLTRPLDGTLLEAPAGAPAVSAMIDVSDGLARDLATLCTESGVGAVVEEARLPFPQALRGMIEKGAKPAPAGGGSGTETPNHLTELVLSSGEEYVMLATVRGLGAGAEVPGGTVIGRIVDRKEGVSIVTADGERRPLPELGYEHTF
jgi:thiamine-monophosphate kinase